MRNYSREGRNSPERLATFGLNATTDYEVTHEPATALNNHLDTFDKIYDQSYQSRQFALEGTVSRDTDIANKVS